MNPTSLANAGRSMSTCLARADVAIARAVTVLPACPGRSFVSSTHQGHLLAFGLGRTNLKLNVYLTDRGTPSSVAGWKRVVFSAWRTSSSRGLRFGGPRRCDVYTLGASGPNQAAVCVPRAGHEGLAMPQGLEREAKSRVVSTLDREHWRP